MIIVLLIPVTLAAVTCFGLHRRCHGDPAGARLAWGAIFLLSGFSVVALLSVGPFFLIAVLLLIAAAVVMPVGPGSKEKEVGPVAWPNLLLDWYWCV